MKLNLENDLSGKPKEPTKEEIMASMKEKESKFWTKHFQSFLYSRFFTLI